MDLERMITSDKDDKMLVALEEKYVAHIKH